MRRFRGPEGYTRLDLIPSTVASPEVVVSRLRMLDNATAQIDWRLTGSLGPFPLDLVGTTTLSLNLLTGRIEAQREAWDLSATPLPGRVAWSAAAAAWAVRRVGKDAAAATGRAIDTLSSSLDEEETIHPPGPNDPMRFFQQRDTGKQDAITFTAGGVWAWVGRRWRGGVLGSGWACGSCVFGAGAGRCQLRSSRCVVGGQRLSCQLARAACMAPGAGIGQHGLGLGAEAAPRGAGRDAEAGGEGGGGGRAEAFQPVEAGHGRAGWWGAAAARSCVCAPAATDGLTCHCCSGGAVLAADAGVQQPAGLLTGPAGRRACV